MDEVERAVEFALDPDANEALRQEATNFCEAAKRSIDGWHACLDLFVALPQRSQSARFFALQTLEQAVRQRYFSLHESTLLQAKDRLLNFIAEFNYGTAGEPTYIRNKLAQVICLLFETLYTTAWPGAFDDFILLTKTNVVASSGCELNVFTVDIFLRVLLAIDSEIGDVLIARDSEQQSQSTALKDLVRDRESDKLAKFWYETACALDQSYPDTTKLLFEGVSKWVSWFNIATVANDQFMQFTFSKLQDSRLRISACSTIASVISKKMAAPLKLQLIDSMKLDYLVSQPVSDDDDFVEELARLANAQGIELVHVSEDTNLPMDAAQTCQAALQRVLPQCIQFLSNPYDEVSMCVLPFLTAYLTLLRRRAGREGPTPDVKDVLTFMLGPIVEKMKYDPENYNEAFDEDDESDFEELRRSLKNMEDTIGTISPDIVASFIKGRAIELRSSPSADWPAYEVLFYQVLNYSDKLGLTGPRNRQQMSEEAFELMDCILGLEKTKFEVPSVRLLLMEICVKFHGFFKNRQDLIPVCLVLFLDQYSAHSNLPKIKARSWFLFCRFVRSLGPLLRPYMEGVLNSLADLLTLEQNIPIPENLQDVSVEVLDADLLSSRLYIYETCGVLASSGALSPFEQAQISKDVIDVLLASITSKSNEGGDNLRNVILIYRDICALSGFARGYPESVKRDTELPWSKEFALSAHLCVSVLRAAKQYEFIRVIVRQYLARIMSLVTEPLFDDISDAVSILVESCESSEIVDVISFVMLGIHKYEAEYAPVLNARLGQLLRFVFPIIGSAPSDDEAARIRSSVCKSYFGLVSNIFAHNMSSILLADQQLTDSVLQSVTHFMGDDAEPALQRAAIQAFTRMISTWAAPGVQAPSGFGPIAFNIVSTAALEIPSRPSFKIDDAQGHLVLSDLAALQRQLVLVQESEFGAFMRDTFFPRLRVPADTVDEYLRALVSLDIKEFRQYYSHLITKIIMNSS